jgi:hypothetical protein
MLSYIIMFFFSSKVFSFAAYFFYDHNFLNFRLAPFSFPSFISFSFCPSSFYPVYLTLISFVSNISNNMYYSYYGQQLFLHSQVTVLYYKTFRADLINITFLFCLFLFMYLYSLFYFIVQSRTIERKFL